jgi:hypothetical protein
MAAAQVLLHGPGRGPPPPTRGSGARAARPAHPLKTKTPRSLLELIPSRRREPETDRPARRRLWGRVSADSVADRAVRLLDVPQPNPAGVNDASRFEARSFHGGLRLDGDPAGLVLPVRAL